MRHGIHSLKLTANAPEGWNLKRIGESFSEASFCVSFREGFWYIVFLSSVLLLMEEFLHHQGWWISHIIFQGFKKIPDGSLGFLNHQQYHLRTSGISNRKNGSPFSRKFSKLSVHGVGWTFFGDAGFPRQHFSHGWNRWNYFLVGR